MAKKLKGIGRTLLLVLVSLILGVNIYTWNARSLTGNQVPMPFGYGASVVLSGSMEPALSVGDLLILKEETSYRVDDIVVYQSGKMAVVHRIVAMDEEAVVTQGDANNTPDEAFPVSAIKGKVIRAIPMAGNLVWALKSPMALLGIMALTVALLELSFRSAKQEKEKEQEKIKAEIRRLMQELEEKE